jgi:hypothetical protein
MIEHGASIQFVDKICTIRINDNYPFKSEIERILRDLRIAINSKEFIYKYLLS